MVVALLLGAAVYVSGMQLDDSQADTAASDGFQLAKAFEDFSNENTTELMDAVVVPASLESDVPPQPDPNEKALTPAKPAAAKYRRLASPVYGGALVALEATALLVGGATIVVLLIAKAKSRSAAVEYNYDEGAFSSHILIERGPYSLTGLLTVRYADDVDPLLQSLLYSDMDYAAI